MPRAPAVLLVVVIVFGALFGIGSLIASEASQLASDLPRYTQVMRTKIKDLRGATAGTGSLSRIVDMVQDLGATLQPPPAAEVRGEPGSRTHPLTVELTPARASVVDTLQTFAGPILHPLATTGPDPDLHDLHPAAARGSAEPGDQARRRLGRPAPHHGGDRRRREPAEPVLPGAARPQHRLRPRDRRRPLDHRRAEPDAVRRARGDPAVRALYRRGDQRPSALILAAAVDPGWSMVIATAALFLVVEPICGHVIEPLLYGHSTGLSPVAVILAATIWTFLWGPIGLVLATPLTVCLVVLGRHVERLWYLDVLLGDQPALAPPEIFYQRMLAGDPVEAIDQGWQFLKERALVTYYDEVALAGLLLAQEDLSRGTLDRGRQDEVGAAIRTVVDRLGTAPVARRTRRGTGRGPDTETAAALAAVGPDRQVAGIVLGREDLAPNWRGETPVLCVSSRGPFDEAATLMLSQILARHGLASQTLSMASIRAGERPENPEALALICFSYLEPVSLSQIRFTVRQARAAVPGVRILSDSGASATRRPWTACAGRPRRISW